MEFVIILLFLALAFITAQKGKWPAAATEDADDLEMGSEIITDEGIDGYAGGSMPDIHTEGESPAEHRRHVAAVKQREAAETARHLAESEHKNVKLQDLRRAVVMSEILDKPVSLRRK